MSLKSFFQPQSVAVVGASENPQKLGSVIFQNILDSKFTGQLYAINPKLADKDLLQKPAYADLTKAPNALDLVIIVIPQKFVESVIDQCVTQKAKNVIIISAGFSEVGHLETEKNIQQKCSNAGINLLGPNCLGAIFPYAHLNASFADGYPESGHICFVSQSGAFCTAMLDWATQKKIGFSHFISLGNKAGISENDILETLAEDPKVKIFAFYLESLANGKIFLEKIRQIAPHKPIVILEPGKSVKAAEAASSHTGSLAPNSRILEMAYQQAGAIQVFSMRAMFGLLETLTYQPQKNFGENLAILTNAGGVGVLTTDLTEANGLNLAKFETKTLKSLRTHLPAEANTKNPVDIIGDARADRYQTALEIITKDKNVDQILVLLTPQRTTEVQATAHIISEINAKTDKNIVASFIGGQKISTALPILAQHQIPHFEFPVDATRVLGLLSKNVECRMSNVELKSEKVIANRQSKIINCLKAAKENKYASLPQNQVNEILTHYDFDFPQNCNFDDFEKALDCAKQFFPKSVVMKISAPQALHKTDLKGVVLNVNSTEKFTEVWNNFEKTIDAANLKNAHIQIQEQVPQGIEIILGITSDPNFGPVMLFGHGGIYTEVFRDTTVRVLPTQDFEKMIDETHISKVLHGVRGQAPKAIKKLLETMHKMQQLVLDYPQIKAIDANPIMITEDRAVAVDFKILV